MTGQGKTVKIAVSKMGKALGEILGYSDTAKAIRTHVDDEDKLMSRIDTSGQNRNMFIINESGL